MTHFLVRDAREVYHTFAGSQTDINANNGGLFLSGIKEPSVERGGTPRFNEFQKERGVRDPHEQGVLWDRIDRVHLDAEWKRFLFP